MNSFYRFLIISSFLSAFCISSAQATSIAVSGSITNSTTWFTDSVVIQGDLTVNTGVTLTINPGVIVLFTGSYSMTIDGNIKALGTASDTIYFTTPLTTPYWAGLRIDDPNNGTDSMIFRYVAFSRVSTHSVIEITDCSNIFIDHCAFIRPRSAIIGGLALQIIDSDPVITNSLFVNGFSNFDDGGAIYIEQTTTSFTGASQIIGNSFIKNQIGSGKNGGAIYIKSITNTDTIYIKNNYFFGNRAGGVAAAINTLSSNVAVINNHFLKNGFSSENRIVIMLGGNNQFSKNQVDSNISSYYMFTFSNAYVDSNVFLANTCANPGNVVQLSADVRFNNNILEYNSGGEGAALLVNRPIQPGDSMLITNNIFRKNTGISAVMLDVSDLRTLFINNTVNNNQSAGISIDCHQLLNDTFVLDNNVITNNDSAGVNVYISTSTGYRGTIFITDNEISDNKFGGLSFERIEEVGLYNNRVTRNEGSFSGGGVTFDDCSYALVRNNFFQNNNAHLGGAIYIKDSDVDVVNNIITNNTSNNHGGGIYVFDGTGLVLVANNSISNNHATGKGGGFYTRLTYNIPFYNNILYGNSAGISGPQMYWHYDNYDPDFYNNNLEGGTAAVDWNFGSFTGSITGAQDTIPYYVSPSVGTGFMVDTALNADWALSSNSTLIDSGYINTTGLSLPNTDIRGAQRITNGKVDIGAYESLGAISFTISEDTVRVCSGDSIYIAASSSWSIANYQWIRDGQVVSGANQSNLLLYPSDTSMAGYYQLLAIVGLDTAYSDSIPVYVGLPPVNTIVGSDTTLCFTDSYSINVMPQSSTTYLWSNGATSSSISIDSTYSYYCVLTNDIGCSSTTDTLDIVKYDEIALQSLGGLDTLCGNDTVSIAASVPAIFYFWNTGATSQTIKVADSGEYYVTIVDLNGCATTSDTATFKKFPNPVLSWTGDPKICQNNGDTVMSFASPKGGYYLGSGIFNDSVFNPASLSGGDYELTYVYEDINGCVDSISDSIGVIIPKTFAGLRKDTSICAGDSILVDAGTGFADYNWSTGDTTSSIYARFNIKYIVEVTDSNTCSQMDSMQLTLNSPSTGTDVITSCDSLTWIDGITYYSSNNTATFTLPNSLNCDSVITLDLTITNSNTGTDVITACDSLIWIDGVTYKADNNSATFTLTNAQNCDSVVTLDLTITNSTTGVDVVSACDSYTWIDGITYTSDNNSATFNLVNSVGCDSTVALDLTINTIDNSVIAGGDSILSNETGATYRWLDCDNNFAPISGATTQLFKATSNGSYAVEVSKNGCLDTSNCVSIIGIGVDEFGNSGFELQPNPTTGQFSINLKEKGEGQYVIYNSLGEVVAKDEFRNTVKIKVELPSGISSGNYYVKVLTLQEVYTTKLVFTRE